MEAIKLGSTAIGICTSQGVVLAVEKRITSPLMEPSTIEKIVEVDHHIGKHLPITLTFYRIKLFLCPITDTALLLYISLAFRSGVHNACLFILFRLTLPLLILLLLFQGCAVSGLIADSRTMMDRARLECQNHWFVYDEKMTVESVAQAVSNLAIQFGDSDEDGGAMVCIFVFSLRGALKKHCEQ